MSCPSIFIYRFIFKNQTSRRLENLPFPLPLSEKESKSSTNAKPTPVPRGVNMQVAGFFLHCRADYRICCCAAAKKKEAMPSWRWSTQYTRCYAEQQREARAKNATTAKVQLRDDFLCHVWLSYSPLGLRCSEPRQRRPRKQKQQHAGLGLKERVGSSEAEKAGKARPSLLLKVAWLA